MKIIFSVINNNGEILSGGDRIWIEFIRNWGKKLDITILECEESHNLAQKYCIADNINEIIVDKKFNRDIGSLLNLAIFNIKRSVKGIFYIIKYTYLIKKSDYIYSASDFYPDFLPGFLSKLINKKIKWIAGYYLIAPFPFGKETPYKKKHKLKGLLYWLMQKPSLFIVRRYADFIFVTSDSEAEKIKSRKKNLPKIIVVKGGVDIAQSNEYLNFKNVIPIKGRKYDACFVGRFHMQKGVLELIDIWNIVVKKKNNARLALIGDGILKDEIEYKINKYQLNNNIEIMGFKDGHEKFDVFMNSKIILHPAIFDSGGMAMAEGMAFGLPGISFDLEALKSYYPRGVIKIPCFDIEAFANAIIDLLENEKLYKELSKEAYEYAKTWDFKERANDIYKQVFGKPYIYNR
ncbi:MAG: glycosyltransferase [Candidatus Acididesulfobacter diazotrophicus]|jgi:glycosyltransferase involved in cell wall biosynthesis|uniref:Glycosyltransferase n=1 Tax=Candidatus Acididesulfobacter diazotrophicus TaxID=2597226 RepID=A0A519BQ10_9DELT|nr:MAG: glycosyltransferase [Candidatus Acididesulfobacter diazotrophicus]